MRRTLVVLATAASVTLGVAGPAAASADHVPPPPSTTGDQHCRLASDCHPGLHKGWENKRNVGG